LAAKGERGVPIWCAGRWPNKPGLLRAARSDGAMVTFADQRTRPVPVEEFTAAVAFLRRQGHAGHIAMEGATDAATANEQVAPYVNAGLTWWIEAMGWWRGGVAAAAARIADGPMSFTTGAGSARRRRPVDP
jgi:hypothetical protein